MFSRGVWWEGAETKYEKLEQLVTSHVLVTRTAATRHVASVFPFPVSSIGRVARAKEPQLHYTWKQKIFQLTSVKNISSEHRKNRNVLLLGLVARIVHVYHVLSWQGKTNGVHQHNAVLQKNDWKTYNQILVIFPASTECNVSFSIQLLQKIRSPPSLKLLVDKKCFEEKLSQHEHVNVFAKDNKTNSCH